MNLLVVITGFGEPHIQHKFEILEKNINFIKKGPWKNIHFKIFGYTEGMQSQVPDSLKEENIQWKFKPGIIFEFLYNDVKPETTENYDYIILLLDDVELTFNNHMNWDKILYTKDKLSFNIMSCCLKERHMSYWDFMIHIPNSQIYLKEHNVCEYFCYLIDRESYRRYHQFIDINNPWTWGMDFILNIKMGLKSATVNDWIGYHYYNNTDSKEYSKRAKDSEIYLEKYNLNWEILHKLPRITKIYNYV